MEAQWRIRVRGKQRETVNVTLLVAAVMALGEQLAEQERAAAGSSTDPAAPGRPAEERS